jgi:hypothetical protein
VKSISKARKSLRGFRKLFRRSPPWPGLYENEVNNRLSKAKYKKRRRRQPIREISTASIADMADELEKDWQENVRKLAQALDVSAKMVYAALMGTEKLSKKSVKKRFSLEMKERFRTYEAAEAMAAAILWHSETTFSLFERRPGAKRELAAFILAQEASYKNWDGGTRNSTAANFTEALRR